MVFVSISKTLAFAALTTLALTSSSANAAGESLQSLPTVRHCVHRALREQGSVNLIVTMKRGTDEVLKQADQGEFASRGDKIESLVSRLEKNAKESQAKLIEDIKRKGTEDKPLFGESQSYWITNQIYFKDASPDLVQVLSEMPDIEEIREEKAVELAGAPQAYALPQISRNLTETDVEWNIKKIGAPDVWATGNRGEGVVVGVIDSGAIATHEALRDSFRGEYGWFDPVQNKTQPVDGEGHGSHVVGTIAGSHGIGVAPGAKWMMCRGCGGRKCEERHLLACAEFMMCPTDPNGNKRDCTKAPRVINNSWAMKGNFFDQSIATWRAAGIIPVFGVGNLCYGCSSAAYPSHLRDVIAVGATDKDDGLMIGSCKGPSPTGLVKPDLSAPGVAIRSVSTKDNSAYMSRVGSSMASPHVTGAIALMLSAHPEFKYDQVLAKLRESAATKSLQPSGYECGGTPDTVFPNNQYGSGRLSAAKALGLPAQDEAPRQKVDPCDQMPDRFCVQAAKCLWDATQGRRGKCVPRPTSIDEDDDRPIWS
ncbi:hypothetical protein P43SY_010268 [Pythium insidiosum]|uniref:subtilisin n=1 Tax=Pythium insidiosum TaxID=114742 RepID=A0AAD5Q5F0_PYTIN|nr:hypothetical protein P43SY_010268 [Pythium insidiosum]